MKLYLRILSVAVAIAAMASVSWAGESKTTIGGTFYYDYFVNTTSGADTLPDASKGFELRRAYLTVKKSWGDMLFRYTSDVSFSEETGNLNAYTKYAYLQRKCMLLPGSVLVFGLHSPMSNGWIEQRWHYRSMAKTMSDAQKWTHSSQLGLGLQGKASDGVVEYYFDINNGNGYKNPVAKDGMGFSGRLAFQPVPGFYLSGLFDSNTPGGDKTEANTYFEGLAGYDAGAFELYAQYGMFTNGNADDIKSTGISVFGRAAVKEGINLVGRFDMIDPDTDNDNDGHNWILFGFDLEAHENFFFQPSFRMTSYEADGIDGESEFVLTFYGKI
ncbi:hypothetical protein H8E52_03740 [bacterium]|nr:hypothetical protein [bacterium]